MFLKKQFTDRTLSPNQDELRKILGDLRVIKTDEEMVLLQKAIDISALGHLEVMKSCEPGMYEYSLEAILEFVYQRNGAYYAGYPHIVGSGENSTILHYESSRRKIVNGDLVLVDSGAEYMGYTADVTRTFPANGRFSPEQKAIYELALKAQNAAIDALKVGMRMNETTVIAQEVIAAGLIELGLLKNRTEARRFTIHGVSHYIGLQVHDVGGLQRSREGGEITRPALDILRNVDEIFIQALREAGLYEQIWQAFAVFLPIKSVGVQGDGRTHDNVVALRAVTSSDGMTADWFAFEPKFLARVSARICNEVRGVNRVVYDVTSKPPGTIEWE